MSLVGIKHLTSEKLTEEGFSRFVEVSEGLQVDVNIRLHYDIDDGLFKEIHCTSYSPPSDI